jgi:hypothetical protein
MERALCKTHYGTLSSLKLTRKNLKNWEKQCEIFYPIIEKYVTAEVSCIIPVNCLEKAIDSINWPSRIKDPDTLKRPFYFAFKAIITVMAQHQKEMGIMEPIDFIFDERTDKNHVLRHWDDLKKSSSQEVQKLMGTTPVFKTDEEELPLQAADLIVWWIRIWRKEKKIGKIRELLNGKQKGSSLG